MQAKELKELLKNIKDDADIYITDDEQEHIWEIMECRICEDKASDFFNAYLDIVIH